MKKSVGILLCMVTINAFTQNEGAEKQPPELKNNVDSLNYFLGLSFGYSLGTAQWQPDATLIAAGLLEVLEGEPEHGRQASSDIFQQLHAELMEKGAADAGRIALRNLEEGKAFLERNSQREGVQTTESGLQYEVITQGDGPRPGPASMVEVHYEGVLLDGTVFDSSYQRGETLSFPLNQVIAGWKEGVQLMPLGSIYKLYIPSELAYGSRETETIPANSVLIFRIELIGIE